MAQQARFAATTWSGPTSGDAVGAAPRRGARVEAALADAEDGHHQRLRRARLRQFSSYWTDHTSCWEGDATVDGDLGVDLVAAQQATASYLFAIDLR